jgi:hypothetical protein
MYVDSHKSREFQEKAPRIQLRREKKPDGSQLNLRAYLDTDGWLHVDGQDLGPITAPVSNDGEYEYFKTVAARDIPRLIKLLGGKAGDDILALLKRKWTRNKSYDLEELLEKCDIPVVLSIYSG